MRIVGGTYRGRLLKTPIDNSVRPTTDRVREAIFNILAHNEPALPQGAAVLDLFCGTGAFGLEALSRGARQVTFVDKAKSSLQLAQENAASLGVTASCRFLQKDAAQLQATTDIAGLIFADPPYDRGLLGPAFEAALESGWIGTDTCLLAETSLREAVDVPQALEISRQWTYGQSKITRFSLAS